MHVEEVLGSGGGQGAAGDCEDGSLLLLLVREEAHRAVALLQVLAQPGLVLLRVQPALEHSVGVLAPVPLLAALLAEVGAGHAVVGHQAWVPPAGVLPGMDKGALDPVVAVGPGARPDLEVVHAEVVGGVDGALDTRQGEVGGVGPPTGAGIDLPQSAE